MSIEKKFSWEWQELSGKSCLHVAPQGMTSNQLWMDFFEEIAGTFSDGQAYIFVDVRGVEENISLEGFKEIISIFKKHEVKSAVIAVISTDQFIHLITNMFQQLANFKDFDLQNEAFLSEETATNWMVGRIGLD